MRYPTSVCFTLSLLVFAVACSPGEAEIEVIEEDLLASTIRYSAKPDRSSEAALDGQSLSGPAYIFVNPGRTLKEVAFYVDSPNATGTPRQIEQFAPYDFAGTATNLQANPFDPQTLSPGPHSLTVKITRSSGATSLATSNFTVTQAGTGTGTGGGGASGGAAMPVGDLPGWKQVLAEDFTSTTLDSGWGAYSGNIPSWQGGVWAPSHVTVANGTLQLLGYEDGGVWKTGGVMRYRGGGAGLTYGKFEVRFRMDKASGVKYCLLLWPTSGIWPGGGEIDFAEDGGGDRGGLTATVIYSTDGTTKSQLQKQLKGDFSQWHTLGVEWSPGKLVYTLDGAAWAEVNAAYVPSGPMHLALQTETGNCLNNAWSTCRDATTPSRVSFEADWVVIYSRAAP